jgi:hypothetical protein
MVVAPGVVLDQLGSLLEPLRTKLGDHVRTHSNAGCAGPRGRGAPTLRANTASPRRTNPIVSASRAGHWPRISAENILRSAPTRKQSPNQNPV